MRVMARIIDLALVFILCAICAPIYIYADEPLPEPGAVSLNDSPYFQANALGSSLPLPRTVPRQPKRLSLKEAILLALRNNPDVESSELQRVVDKFALEVAHYAFMPQFTLGGTANFANKSTPSYNIGPGVSITSPVGTTVAASYGNAFSGSPGSVALTMTQHLLKGAGWAYNTIDIANAYDNENIAKLNFKNSVITVVVAVVNSYRALVQDYNNLDIQARTLLRAEQTVQQYELQVKAGKVAPSDLLQQQANVETTRLSMMQQKSSLDADYQNFLQALGLVATAKVIIDKRIELTNYKIPPLKTVIRLALLNNIDYQSAVIRLRASKRAVVSAKNDALWQLDLTASTTVGQSTGAGTNNLVPASTSLSGTPGTINSGGSGPSVGFTLNIPIDNVPAKQGIINARVALEQAQLSLEEKKQELIRNVTNQINQLHNQVEQIRVAIHAIALQEQTVANAEIKLRYGKTTVFEVTQLQDQLLQQQTNLVGNKIQLLNSITTLNQTLGLTLDKWGITLRY